MCVEIFLLFLTALESIVLLYTYGKSSYGETTWRYDAHWRYAPNDLQWRYPDNLTVLKELCRPKPWVDKLVHLSTQEDETSHNLDGIYHLQDISQIFEEKKEIWIRLIIKQYIS